MFVSHNMGTMQMLCERGILLHNGTIAVDDTMAKAVDTYQQSLEQASYQNLSERVDRKGHGKVRLVNLEITDGINRSSSILKTGGTARFVLKVNAILSDIACALFIYDSLGYLITSFNSKIRSEQDKYCAEDRFKFICELDEIFLMPNRYRVDISIFGDNMLQDFVPAAAFFDVAEGTLRGRPVPDSSKVRNLSFRVWMPHRWTHPIKI